MYRVYLTGSFWASGGRLSGKVVVFQHQTQAVIDRQMQFLDLVGILFRDLDADIGKILQFTVYFQGCLIWPFVSCNLRWVTLRVYGFGWAYGNRAPHFWGHFTLLVLSDWRAWVLNTSSLWSFLPFSFWLSCFPASNPLPRSSPALALHYF